MSDFAYPPAPFRWYFKNPLPGTDTREALIVTASVSNGRPHDFQVDTGSCGMLVGPAHVGPPFNVRQPDATWECIKYLPSKFERCGYVTPGVPVTLVKTGRPGVEANVTLLIVEQPADFGGGMLGIGYGKGPAPNPLLQMLRDVAGNNVGAGYIITPEYVEVGRSRPRTPRGSRT